MVIRETPNIFAIRVHENDSEAKYCNWSLVISNLGRPRWEMGDWILGVTLCLRGYSFMQMIYISVPMK